MIKVINEAWRKQEHEKKCKEITKARGQVRENVRNAMKQKPLKYNSLEEALARIASRFEIPMEYWIQRSKLLQDALFQKRITEYLRFA